MKIRIISSAPRVPINEDSNCMFGTAGADYWAVILAPVPNTENIDIISKQSLAVRSKYKTIPIDRKLQCKPKMHLYLVIGTGCRFYKSCEISESMLGTSKNSNKHIIEASRVKISRREG